MMKKHAIHSITAALALFAFALRAEAQTIVGHLPSMESPHEGTWLQWPHHFTYGTTYRSRLDATWVAMTAALVGGEKVHIVAYNAAEQTRITALLNAAAVPIANVNFLIRQTDDCWVRDNGPVFVFDNNTDLKITDWGFDGWGDDTPFVKDRFARVERVGEVQRKRGPLVIETYALDVLQGSTRGVFDHTPPPELR